MPKYVITATEITNYTATIEAFSQEEAMELARKSDKTMFENNGYEFTVDYADKVTE